LANAESFAQPNSRLIYAAVAAPHSSHKVDLYVLSPSSGSFPKFRRANLPTLDQRSFTIVDASEGTVFIHINHNDPSDPSGSVYVSDLTGMQFSLSLPNNRRDVNGAADFERVAGLEGVYIANYLHHEDSTGAVVNYWQGIGQKRRDRHQASIRTAISFDRGGVWSYLLPPQYDALGEEISCWGHEDCYLHLHGVNDEFGEMKRSASALGLILSKGSIGSQLDRSVAADTYLSRDAGLTWEEVAKGIACL
jgi:hypothetical protein